MKDFLCGIRAEGLKMKHTFLLRFISWFRLPEVCCF